MKAIVGTRTEKNLLISFAGESQARNRYDLFAKQAKKDGFQQIAAIFEETALHEYQHARRMFEFLEGCMVQITATYPAGKVGTTLENLEAAASGEHEEWSDMYPEFARIAREEGFEQVARMYENVSVSERHHEERFRALAELVKNQTMFCRSDAVSWTCRKCGYTHHGSEPPKACPACAHSQADRKSVV